MNWHECGVNTVLNILKSGGKSFICLSQNGNFSWIEVSGIKEAMLILAVVFFVIVYSKKKMVKKKKK